MRCKHTPDIVKICLLVPVVFSFHIGGVFHVKSSCLLWLILLFFIVYSSSHLTRACMNACMTAHAAERMVRVGYFSPGGRIWKNGGKREGEGDPRYVEKLSCEAFKAGLRVEHQSPRIPLLK